MAGYEIRAALPDDAESILRLVNDDYAEHGFPPVAPPTDEQIAVFAERIRSDTIMRRTVALGDNGIAAYAKDGSWGEGGYVHTFGNPLQRIIGGWYKGGTGLYELAASHDEPDGYFGEAVKVLVENTRLFDVEPGNPVKVAVAGVDFPEMRPFTDFLRDHDVHGTGLFAMIAVNGISRNVRAELWLKKASKSN